MIAGFAIAESGFTRVKNAGNIIMMNLIGFCVGAIAYCILGYGLMRGHSLFGIIGTPNVNIFTTFQKIVDASYDGFGELSSFLLALVICGIVNAIISGAMAGRTKFSACCIYSAVIGVIVFPIVMHWTSGGWLYALGFHDYGGSATVHIIGGIAALAGASVIGARVGKYDRDKNGNVVKVHAIPGHNIPLAALGVFIIWFGFYGLNSGVVSSSTELSYIFMTTTIAPIVSTLTTMVFTWKKNGKPDISLCLNAALAGLVSVAAGSNAYNALGAVITGFVSGILVVVFVEMIDMKYHIDDPVGVIAVHGVNGIWGTIAVGLFADPAAPAALNGLFFTLDPRQLGIQLLGAVVIAGFVYLIMMVTFKLINKYDALRISAEEEIAGLDTSEHGLSSAYPDFAPSVESFRGYSHFNAKYSKTAQPYEPKVVTGSVPAAEAVEVKRVPKLAEESEGKFTKIEIICKEERLYNLKEAMMDIGITGMTVSHVMGCGLQKGKPEYYRGVQVEANLLPKVQVDIVVSKIPVRTVVNTAMNVLYTGHIGDGKIFVYDVENVIKVRTGEEGFDALQDVE